ncbi:MAG TPA: STAS domain-containing protein [Leptospiraceae bacterium]|jgi:anti-anti-sigma factor|nr:STAS domain-containing protein [Leptospiraceae bacterium]MBK7058049.1 STAS domain-containing protein [Leptospiraceae bacterium]MBK8399089.1 STAS domain-containing protein [Leptospiraceae bacterium]MBK9501808.1 STAS domain-containing protein [Leptospiraceae bacterium]MBL0264589.1 STAS domain-containing protein [Leptospiraceae bacterium]
MFKSEVEVVNGVCTISLNGNISLKNAIQLKELIMKQVDNGILDIVLDFGENVYIDSSGIGAIFNSQKYVNEKNGILKIKNIGHETMTILKIANLDKHLNII